MTEQLTNVAGSGSADQLPLPVTTHPPAVERGIAASGTERAFTPTPHPCLQFSVYGIPIPQGSHKGFVVNGRAVITNDNKRTRPWRQDMTHAALEALGDRPALTGPVEVRVQFVMPRPKAHYRTGRNADLLRDGAPTYPAGKPDVDKLARNLLDSLTAAAVVRDDAQVVHLCAHKVYADGGARPGAHVYVTQAAS